MIVKKDRGVTLIELMIVMVIAAFLVAGIYSLFITQHRSYSVQDQVAGVQQDARVALDIMARDIRMAGFWTGAGSGTGFFGVGAIDGCNYAVVPVNGGTNASDQITVVLAAEQVATVTGVSNQTVSLSGGVGGTAGLNVNDFVAFEGETQVYRILQIDTPNPDDIQVNGNPPNHLGDIGAQAYRVRAITYSLTTPADGSLRRNEGSGAQPLAGDGITTFVEDLQFAYQMQGQADPTLWYNTPAAAGATNADIRMVKINIIVRTVVPDSQDTSFFKPACEDRPREDTFTGCRRRVYTTVVKVRNL